jgi:hypothetical protein
LDRVAGSGAVQLQDSLSADGWLAAAVAARPLCAFKIRIALISGPPWRVVRHHTATQRSELLGMFLPVVIQNATGEREVTLMGCALWMRQDRACSAEVHYNGLPDLAHAARADAFFRRLRAMQPAPRRGEVRNISPRESGQIKRCLWLITRQQDERAVESSFPDPAPSNLHAVHTDNAR